MSWSRVSVGSRIFRAPRKIWRYVSRIWSISEVCIILICSIDHNSLSDFLAKKIVDRKARRRARDQKSQLMTHSWQTTPKISSFSFRFMWINGESCSASSHKIGDPIQEIILSQTKYFMQDRVINPIHGEERWEHRFSGLRVFLSIALKFLCSSSHIK